MTGSRRYAGYSPPPTARQDQLERQVEIRERQLREAGREVAIRSARSISYSIRSHPCNVSQERGHTACAICGQPRQAAMIAPLASGGGVWPKTNEVGGDGRRTKSNLRISRVWRKCGGKSHG
jgi:hypothetical protein